MLRTLRDLLLPKPPGAREPAAGPDALVQVYERAGRCHVEPSDRTRLAEAGYWIATGAVTVLEPDGADEELGAAVLQAIARSRVEVAVPPRDAKLEAGLFRAMGVRSRRAAMAGTRSCLISREPARAATPGGPAAAARLRIEALHNGGTRGDGRGYTGAAGQTAVELPVDADARRVGEVVRSALRQATMVA